MIKQKLSVAISILAMTGFLAACGDDGDGKGAKPTITAGPVDTPTAGPTDTPGEPTITATPGEPTITATPGDETPVPTATATPGDEAGLIAPLVDSAPTGIDDPLWANVTALTPELSNQSTGLVYGMCQLNMSGTEGGLDSFNGGDPANLQMKAVHDGEKIYILAEWNDTEFNLDRRRWLYDGPTDPLKEDESTDGWTSQLNDDKIGLAFEIDNASSAFGSFDEAGCAASCHNVDGEGLDMRPAEGSVDIWHWKTSRSEPLGYVNDQNSNPDDGRTTDAGTGIENRNRISDNCSGAMVEWDGTEQAFMRWDGEMITLDPAYILLGTNATDSTGDGAAGDATYDASCAGCHQDDGMGVGQDFTDPAWTGVSRDDLAAAIGGSSHPGAGAWNGLSAEEQTNVLLRLRGFSGIPGYYLMPPDGSAADVVTQSNVDYEMVDGDALMRTNYRLLMVRDLDTGNEDDATLGVGENIVFGVALMDNDGRNHIGSAREVLFLEAGTAAATIAP